MTKPTHITFFSNTGESPDSFGSVGAPSDNGESFQFTVRLGVSKRRAILAVRALLVHLDENYEGACDVVATEGLGSLRELPPTTTQPEWRA